MNKVKNTRLKPYRKKSKLEKIQFVFSIALFLLLFSMPINANASLGGYGVYTLYQTITNEVVEANNIMNKALEYAKMSPFAIIEGIGKTNTNYGLVETLKTASQSLSLVVATLLLCIDFFKKSVNFEWSRSWENVLLFIVKCIVIKVLVQNTDNIIESIYQGFNYLNTQVTGINGFQIFPTGSERVYTIIPESKGLLGWIVRRITGYDDTVYTVSAEAVNFLHPDFYVPDTVKCSPGTFEDKIAEHNPDMMPIVTLLLDQIYFLAMKTLAILVFVQIIGRAFELTVYTLLAPLPLATFASDGCSDVAKNFIKKYIACILQITVIITMLLAYQGLMKVADFKGIMHFAAFISLSMGIMKSGQWSKTICGTS